MYKKNWGLAEWAPHVTDWSRNLYRGPAGDVSAMLDVPPGGALYFAAFDGVPDRAVESRRQDLEAKRADIIWMPVVGLDRSVPIIGCRTIAEDSHPPPLPRELAAGIRETIYQPITDRARAK